MASIASDAINTVSPISLSSSFKRLLWDPLVPRVTAFAQENPSLAVAVGLITFPVTFVVLLFLLFWDKVLQWLYEKYLGDHLEVLHMLGPTLLRLGLAPASVAGKASLRTAQQNFIQDPVGMSGNVISASILCVLHPFRILNLVEKATDPLRPAMKASWESYKLALWAKRSSEETLKVTPL